MTRSLTLQPAKEFSSRIKVKTYRQPQLSEWPLVGPIEGEELKMLLDMLAITKVTAFRWGGSIYMSAEEAINAVSEYRLRQLTADDTVTQLAPVLPRRLG